MTNLMEFFEKCEIEWLPMLAVDVLREIRPNEEWDPTVNFDNSD